MLKSVHLFGCSSGFVSNLLKPNSIVGFSLTSISSKRLSASSSLSCSSSILSCSSSASLFLAPRTGSFKAFCGSTCSEANQEGTSSSPLSMSESPPPSSSTVVHSSVSHSFYWLVFFKFFLFILWVILLIGQNQFHLCCLFSFIWVDCDYYFCIWGKVECCLIILVLFIMLETDSQQDGLLLFIRELDNDDKWSIKRFLFY